MQQPVLPTRAFAGDVPANLSCGFCKRPVQQQFYRTLNRFACSNCAAQVQGVIDKNSVAPASFLVATGAGLAAALAGGAAWAVVVHITHVYIGILAAFIGVGVGKAVHFASGKRRSVSLQWLCVVLAVIGVAAGKIGLVGWGIADALRADGAEVTVQNMVEAFRYIWQHDPSQIGDPYDLLWIGIAAYAAFRLCKPQNISIVGPYAYQPSSGSLQFDTVEPLHDIPPATPPGNP